MSLQEAVKQLCSECEDMEDSLSYAYDLMEEFDVPIQEVEEAIRNYYKEEEE